MNGTIGTARTEVSQKLTDEANGYSVVSHLSYILYVDTRSRILLKQTSIFKPVVRTSPKQFVISHGLVNYLLLEDPFSPPSSCTLQKSKCTKTIKDDGS